MRLTVDHERRQGIDGVHNHEVARRDERRDVELPRAKLRDDALRMALCRDHERRLSDHESFAKETSDDAAQRHVVVVEPDGVKVTAFLLSTRVHDVGMIDHYSLVNKSAAFASAERCVRSSWTNAPSRVRARNLTSTSRDSSDPHVSRSRPHKRQACGGVRRRPGISRNSLCARWKSPSGTVWVICVVVAAIFTSQGFPSAQPQKGAATQSAIDVPGLFGTARDKTEKFVLAPR